MTLRHIDPIKVAEASKRLEQQAQMITNSRKAADALLWFEEHAKPTARASSVIRVKADIIASATPNAKIAQEFVNNAVAHFIEDILQRAIEQATNVFNAAEAESGNL